MGKIPCIHWREYDSIAGSVCYCEVAAFNKKVSQTELVAIGCTPERREECLKAMNLNTGIGSIPTISCSSPKEVASSVVDLAQKKATTPVPNLWLLGTMAGAYIALGAQLSTVVTNDLSRFVGDGLCRIISGLVFSLGLILVVIAGAELFTGNSLMVTGWLNRRVTTKQLMTNWSVVYTANFIGALVVALMLFGSGLWKLNGGMIGARALAIANAKINMTWGEAVFRGVLCNWLVCLAVWLASSCRDNISKMLAIAFPVAAFVASGFEHSIANMYFVPMGLFLKGYPVVLEALGRTVNQTLASPEAILAGSRMVSDLTWGAFFVRNLIPVTIGNIIGGTLFVGAAYWNVYLKREFLAPAGAVRQPAVSSSLTTASSRLAESAYSAEPRR